MLRGFVQNRRLLVAVWFVILLWGAYRCYDPIQYDPTESAPMTEEAVRMGHSVYANGAFSNPYQTLNTGPTAHTAPGFPLVVAAIYEVFGDGPHGAYALKMVEATVVLAQIASLPFLMRALGMGVRTGLLGALLAVVGVRRVPTWEANYVGLLLILATFLASRYYSAIRGKGRGPGGLHSPQTIAWLAGLLWGVILLTGPSAVSIWAVWLILGVWLSRRHGYGYAWLPMLVVPALLAAPWEWRNYEVFHAVVPVRDSFGLELSLSNNPCAKDTLWLNRHGETCYAHPNDDIAEAQKVIAFGEVNYNRQKQREAGQWIASNPRKALTLWTHRFELFWFPDPGRQIAMWTIDLLTPFSLLGLFFLARKRRESAVLLASFLLIFPLLYYAIQASERYRFPILWVTFALGAAGIAPLSQWIFNRFSFRTSSMSPGVNNRPQWISGIAYVSASLLIAALLFLLFEGAASFVMVARNAFQPASPLAERRHTKYDPQLGWVNIPNVYLRDMYGPGIYLRTNSRGFRSDTETSTSIPAGRVRLICSGDSFTLGYGVSNDHTWCQDLTSLDGRLETVNMGQGGYGLDQAYLWYARDGLPLDSNAHLFAFIGSDLRRMGSNTFEGYSKPTLGIQGGHLVTRNVPVQQIGSWGRLTQRLLAFRDLQSIQLAQHFLFRHPLQSDGVITDRTLDVANAVFDRLVELNRKKGAQLIIAFLPTEGEYRVGMPDYIVRLKKDVTRKGIAWVDLVEDFRNLPPEQAKRLFISQADVPQYKSAAGHYTTEGNAFVAQLLYRRIIALPSVAAELGRLPKPRNAAETLASNQ